MGPGSNAGMLVLSSNFLLELNQNASEDGLVHVHVKKAYGKLQTISHA